MTSKNLYETLTGRDTETFIKKPNSNSFFKLLKTVKLERFRVAVDNRDSLIKSIDSNLSKLKQRREYVKKVYTESDFAVWANQMSNFLFSNFMKSGGVLGDHLLMSPENLKDYLDIMEFPLKEKKQRLKNVARWMNWWKKFWDFRETIYTAIYIARLAGLWKPNSVKEFDWNVKMGIAKLDELALNYILRCIALNDIRKNIRPLNFQDISSEDIFSKARTNVEMWWWYDMIELPSDALYRFRDDSLEMEKNLKREFLYRLNQDSQLKSWLEEPVKKAIISFNQLLKDNKQGESEKISNFIEPLHIKEELKPSIAYASSVEFPPGRIFCLLFKPDLKKGEIGILEVTLKKDDKERQVKLGEGLIEAEEVLFRTYQCASAYVKKWLDPWNPLPPWEKLEIRLSSIDSGREIFIPGNFAESLGAPFTVALLSIYFNISCEGIAVTGSFNDNSKFTIGPVGNIFEKIDSAIQCDSIRTIFVPHFSSFDKISRIQKLIPVNDIDEIVSRIFPVKRIHIYCGERKEPFVNLPRGWQINELVLKIELSEKIDEKNISNEIQKIVDNIRKIKVEEGSRSILQFILAGPITLALALGWKIAQPATLKNMRILLVQPPRDTYPEGVIFSSTEGPLQFPMNF